MNLKINPTYVGTRIREIRKSLGLSMAAFADRINRIEHDQKAKSGTVSNWETGKNLPNNERLKIIADIGGISVVELLYGPLRSYAHDRISELINEEKDYEFTDETKIEIINSAVNQSLKNTFANMFYAIGEFATVDNELSNELAAAIKRKFTKTEFSNSGLLKYSSSEITAIKSGVNKYLENGVDQEICNDVQKVLSRANNEIASLHVKHKNKLN